MTFTNRTVLVAGATGNLGRAVANAFAQRGANLVLVSLRRESLEKTFGAGMENRLLVPANLLDQEQVNAAVKKAIVRFRRIDVLCGRCEHGASVDVEQEAPGLARRLMDRLSDAEASSDVARLPFSTWSRVSSATAVASRAASVGRNRGVYRATRWAAASGQAFGRALTDIGFGTVLGLRVPYFGTGVVSGVWIALIGWFLNNAAMMSYRQLHARERYQAAPRSPALTRGLPELAMGRARRSRA